MIHCTGVYKSYQLGEKRVEALRGVDLSIDAPGFYGIMGASGSGKSTLMHLMAALDQPDAGSVVVDGQALQTMSERDLTLFRRHRIGIVFQQFNLIPTFNAIENITLPAMLAGKEDAGMRDRAAELLARLGLEGRGKHRPDALSGGEQQRVAIARALLFKPRVLLADEPTGNLDSASSARLWVLLKEIAAQEGMTVMMVTHEPAAAAHCARVYVLRDGVVTGTIESEGLDAGGVAARYQQLVR